MSTYRIVDDFKLKKTRYITLYEDPIKEIFNHSKIVIDGKMFDYDPNWPQLHFVQLFCDEEKQPIGSFIGKSAHFAEPKQ